MYKKYIWVNGKRYGPYLYHNKRVGQKIVTSYHGRHETKENKEFFFQYKLVVLLAVVFSSLLLFLVGQKYEGVLFSPEFEHLDYRLENLVVGEFISGKVQLNLRQGELIPYGTEAIVSLNGLTERKSLSEVLDAQTDEGDFYVEGVDLADRGLGYGIKGIKKSYPDIDFEFRMNEEKKNESEEVIDSGRVEGSGGEDESVSDFIREENASGEQEETGIEETGDFEESGESRVDSGADTPDESSSAGENEANADSSEDSISGEDSGSEKDSGESSDEDSSEESSGASDDSSSEEISSGTGGGESKSRDNGGSFEGDSGADSDSSSSGDSGGEPSLSPTVIINGKVNALEDFVYEIEEEQDVQIVSISVGGEKVEKDLINLEVSGGKAIFSTEYFIEEEGFGEDFLTDKIYSLEFDLDRFKIPAQKDSNFQIVFEYNGQELFSKGEKILSKDTLSFIRNDTFANESVMTVNETINQSVKNFSIEGNVSLVNSSKYGAILGKPVKWRKKVDVSEVTVQSVQIKIPQSAENVVIEKIDDGLGTELEGDKEVRINEIEEIINDSIIEEDIENVQLSPSLDEKEIQVELTGTEEIVEVLYETPAPEIVKEEIIRSGKRIYVSSPSDVTYENVLLYTSFEDSWQSVGVDKIKIKWIEADMDLNIEDIIDFDGDGKLDLLFVAPHLSNQTFEIIIFITKAEHLDSNRSFISDVYEEVRKLDGIWSENISDGEYVRVVFERNLTSENDITVFPRITNGTPRIEVYEKDGSEVIASFDSLSENELNKVYLIGLNGEQDTFDLRILGGSVEFDWIVDPTAFPGGATELRVQNCTAANDDAVGTYPDACDGSYPNSCGGLGDLLSCNDNEFESQSYTMDFNFHSGVNISVYNSSINNCLAINSVFLCYEWWSTSPFVQNCLIAVDADGGASYTSVISDCSGGIGTIPNPGVTCTDVTSLESWTCESFFGVGGIKAMAKNQISRNGGTAGGELRTDVLFFNVSYNTTELTECSVLNQENKVYTLENDISAQGNCFTITANNITLDGQGKKVVGNGSDTGVIVYPVANSTIKNLNITNFTTGVLLWQTGYSSVFNNSVGFNKGYGIYLASAHNNTIKNNTAVNNSIGLGFITDSNQNMVLDNIMERNDFGIHLLNSSGNAVNNGRINNSINAIILEGIKTAGNNLTNIEISGSGGLDIDFVTAGINGTYLIDQEILGYNFLGAGGTVYFKETGLGEIKFLEAINGSGNNLSDDVKIGFNSAIVETENNIGLNRSANITLFGLENYFKDPIILRDGYKCEANICNNLTALLGDNVTFNVTSWTKYSLGDTIKLNECRILGVSNFVYDLENDVNSSGTCFTIAANNITLDGKGFSINYSQSAVGYGIDDSGGYDNFTIKNTRIEQGSTQSNSHGIQFNQVDKGTIINNTIKTYGADSKGISFQSSPNNAISNNNILTEGSAGGGIYLQADSDSNTILNNTINSTNSISLALNFGAGYPEDNVFMGNKLINNFGLFQLSLGEGINRTYLIDQPILDYNLVGAGGTVYFKDSQYGEIKFLEAINGSGTNLTRDVRILNNSATVRSDLNAGLNKSANITLYGIGNLGFSIPQIMRDGIKCLPGVCTNLTAMDAADVEFNVSYWTNYSIRDARFLTQCGILNVPNTIYELQNDIPINGTCFDIKADNITLDGKGFLIEGNTTGDGVWVSASGKTNIKITNLSISNFSVGIFFDLNVNNSLIEFVNSSSNKLYGISLDDNSNNNQIRNSVTNNNKNTGILLTNSSNNSIINNTASDNSEKGIYLFDNSNGNQLVNNNANNNGNTGAGVGYGIFVNAKSNNNQITNNTLNGNGKFTGAGYGIYIFDSSNNNSITNNIINDSIGTLEYGIDISTNSDNNQIKNNAIYKIRNDGLSVFNSNNNQIINNVIYIDSEGRGIQLISSSNNLIKDGIINGSTGYSIKLSGTGPTNNTFNNITLTNALNYDLQVDSGINGNYFVDMHHIGNYTFIGAGGTVYFKDSQYGEIKFLEAINGTGTNLSNDIRIGNNSVVVESTSNVGLNRSANITLYNIFNVNNPEIKRNGVSCGNLCSNFTALNGAEVKFNVSYWTNYSIGETNEKPSVVDISDFDPSGIDIVPGSFAPVQFSVIVNDSNGYNDIEDVNATFSHSNSSVWNVEREDLSCAFVDNLSLTDANYSCVVDVWYFDRAGLWNVSVSAIDNEGLVSDYYNESFVLMQTVAYEISLNQLSWTGLAPGEIDILASESIVINNTGNANATLGINLTAVELIGEEDNLFKIPAENFSSNIISFCGGDVMVNGTGVIISGSLLPPGNNSLNLRNESSGQEEIWLCLEQVPLGLPQQIYSTNGTTPWNLEVVFG